MNTGSICRSSGGDVHPKNKERLLKQKMVFAIVLIVDLALALTSAASAQGPKPGVRSAANPLGTGFSYQGQLKQNGNSVNAACSFNFTLWDSPTDGVQIGNVQSQSLAVANGLFTSNPIDFGASAFQGDARYLQIAVQCPGDATATTLSRQLLAAAPYALYANDASRATNFSGALNGDVTGNQSSTSVVKLRGIPVAQTSPSNGQVLQFGAGEWAPVTLPAAASWNLTGNSGTNPTNNFIGTTDNTTLTLRVNNLVGWRLVPYGPFMSNIIGGSDANSVTSGVQGAMIGGGGSSGSPNRVYDDFSVIGGGSGNQAGYDSADTSDAFYATIGGGINNKASFNEATVGGGGANTASGRYSTIGGGGSNTASATYSLVSGGYQNVASGYAAAVGGGHQNTAAGSYSFVAGNRAKNTITTQGGVFLFADANSFDFPSTAANQFRVRSTGGAQFVTGIDGSGNPTAGVQVAAGGGSWSSLSDRNVKANIAAVNGRDVLARLQTVPVSTWSYQAQDTSIRHIGPMAQDFYSAFQVGEDDRHISTVDADGVAFAAIQGLNQVIQEKNAEIETLKAEVSDLQSQNAKQQAQLDELQSRMTTLEEHGSTSPLPPAQLGLLVGVLAAAIAIGWRRSGDMQ
jgi:hypothetical protein